MPQIMYAHSLYTSCLGATLYLSIKIRFRHRKDTIGWPYCIQGFNILLYFVTEKSRHLYDAIAFWCFQVDRRIRFAVLVSMIEHLIFPSNHVFRTDLAYLRCSRNQDFTFGGKATVYFLFLDNHPIFIVKGRIPSALIFAFVCWHQIPPHSLLCRP